MQLRWYQQEAVDSVWEYFRNNTGNPVLALPTGTGKSVVIAKLVESVLKAYPDQRVMMLTHVKELIQQNYDKLRAVWPAAPAGIYSAGLKRKEYQYPITYAGIDSVAKRGLLFQRTNLMFIDECDLVSDKETGAYISFFNSVAQHNPHLKIIGLTATPWRMGMGMLTDGKIFDDICYDLTKPEDFARLIAEGHLCRLIPKRTNTEMDTSGLKTSSGDYNNAQMAERYGHDYELCLRSMKETARRAVDRKKWLIFSTGIEHLELTLQVLSDMGIPAIGVHSKMSDAERDRNIAEFKAGKYRAMVNKDILTTGFDDPEIDCIVVLRPTKSSRLWVQLLGRGTRPFPGKDNCLVLDFAGNTEKLGPIDMPKIPNPKGKGGGEAPSKVCEKCETINHISARFCVDCGEAFHFQDKYDSDASTLALLSSDKEAPKEIPQNWHNVANVFVTKLASRKGGPDMMRIAYHGYNGRQYTELLCLNHPHNSTAYQIACRRWFRLAPPNATSPKDVDQGLAWYPYLRKVNKVLVKETKPHPEVIDYEFGN